MTLPYSIFDSDGELPLILVGRDRGFGKVEARLRLKDQDPENYANRDLINTIVYDVVVTWEESVSPLSDNDNWNGGVRIFPGRSTPTDTDPRNELIARVTVDPTFPTVPVAFRILDVDDATDEGVSPGSEIDPSGIIDENGDAGDDNFGDPAELLNYLGVVFTDFNGIADVTVRVGMQPGDNYRMAVSFDPNKLNGLAVDDDTEPGYIPSGQAQLPGFAGKLSPMLTVWRKFWFEFDSMGPPSTTGTPSETNTDTATVVEIEAIGFSRTNITIDGITGGVEQYAGGSSSDSGFIIWPNGQDWNKIEVITTVQGIPVPNTFTVVGDVPESLEGQTFTLLDDDWETITTLKRPMPYDLRLGDVAIEKYTRMFIYPLVVDESHSDMDIPFDAYHQGLLDGYQDLSEAPGFWFVSFVAAWQKSITTDNDPEQDNLENGLTDVAGDLGIIYVESIREGEQITELPRLREDLVIVHESGHALGLRHRNTEPPNIMDKSSLINLDFHPEDIRHVRSHDEPNDIGIPF